MISVQYNKVLTFPILNTWVFIEISANIKARELRLNRLWIYNIDPYGLFAVIHNMTY